MGKVGVLSGRRAAIWRQRLVNFALVFSDVALALLCWGTAFVLQSVWGRGALSEITVVSVLPSLAVWVGLRALLGLYPGYGLNQVEELRRQTYALIAAFTITATFAVVLQVGDLLSRLALALAFLSLLLFAPLVRQLVKRQLMKAGLWGKPVIVFSSSEPGGRVATLLTREWGLGYKPVAIFGSQPTRMRRHFEATPDEKSLADATLLSKNYGVNTVIFAMPHTRREHLAKLVHWASFSFQHVTVIPNLDGVANSGVVARDLAGVFGVEIRHNLLNPSVRRIKRALDLAATLTGGILIVPLLLTLCLLIRLESRGPVFYSAQRMGRDGELFSCVKFRTMVPDAEAALQRMLQEDPEAREEYSKYHKLRDDPRVTRIGRFLRKTSLDELPQLWNVLKGDMSLVGPRPYLPRESADIGVAQSEILRVYPGITGPWQVSGRNHSSFEERIKMDAHYVRDWSIWLDLVLLARTVHTVVFDRSAY
jgi:Undecaprenyl-phosphate galactose phosphotransferase WbaP